MNTIQYSPQIGPLYATGASLGPSESSTQTASRSFQPFLPGSIGDRPTDRPTDHATQSVTICRAHSGEAKFVRGLANVGHRTFPKINYVCLILDMLILN